MVIEQAFDDGLAVVERALDGERADIAGIRRRHHPPLHVGDAALRKQHDEIDLVAVAESFDGGAAGVAGRRHDDGAAFAAHRERMIHQPRHELHRQVFEGERRPMKQFKRERIDAELRQRRHRGMAERAIGLARHAGEIGFAERVADERPDHLDRDFGIGPAGEIGDRLGSSRGQCPGAMSGT